MNKPASEESQGEFGVTDQVDVDTMELGEEQEEEEEQQQQQQQQHNYYHDHASLSGDEKDRNDFLTNILDTPTTIPTATITDAKGHPHDDDDERKAPHPPTPPHHQPNAMVAAGTDDGDDDHAGAVSFSTHQNDRFLAKDTFLQDTNTIATVKLQRNSRTSDALSRPGAIAVDGIHHNHRNNDNNNNNEETTICIGEDQEDIAPSAEQQPQPLDLERGRSSDEDNDDRVRSMDLSVPIEAIPVDEEAQRNQLEQEIRQSIAREAIQAVQVELVQGESLSSARTPAVREDGGPQEHHNDQKKSDETNQTAKRKRIRIATLVLVAITILALGLGIGLPKGGTSDKDDAAAEHNNPATVADHHPSLLSTLELVRQRGHVRCGMTEFAFAMRTPTTDKDDHTAAKDDVFSSGFNVEQCKAMALLALGDPTKYEQVFCDHYTRFSYLANGTIDVMTEGATHTMQRDVYIQIFASGFSFTTPYFYSGLSFAGQAKFVDCADQLDSFYGYCRELRICVLDGSTHVQILRELVGGSVIVPYNETDTMLQHMWDETCNVVAGEPLYLLKVKGPYLNGITEGPFASTNYNESEAWKLGSRVASKEPLAVVTRNDDPEWSALANIMVNGFILAEANNITKENAADMAHLFQDMNKSTNSVTEGDKDDDLASLLVSLIATFGNHGDLYQQEIESQIPRGNALNRPYGKDRSTGLLYSMPFGNLDEYGPDPVANGTLEAIVQRGYLRCGVVPSRGPAFVRKVNSSTIPDNDRNQQALWAGLDVELCRGIAGSIFAGDNTKIWFEEMPVPVSYQLLADETVDVVGGARMTLQAMYREPATGHGFSFSTPYYYDNDTKDGYSLMTRSDDEQWQDYIYWMVHALIYAEEEEITSAISADMPVVTLFGESLKQTFRDGIASVGSYAELYNDTVEEYFPRAGANRLNAQMLGAQMFPIPPN